MKNKEKYAKEIVEIASDGFNIAVSRRYNKPMECASANCKICVFNNTEHCGDAFKEWAKSEYIEKQVISKRDRAFLDYLKDYKYMARDYDGELYVYITKPKKRLRNWADDRFKSFRGLDIDFPMVKWSDDEPWKIDDLKKLEVVDEYEQRNTF